MNDKKTKGRRLKDERLTQEGRVMTLRLLPDEHEILTQMAAKLRRSMGSTLRELIRAEVERAAK